MKTTIYRFPILAILSLLLFQTAMAQDHYVQDARKEFRNKNYYWSAFYAASALHATDLSTVQLKSMQSILRESYEAGIQRLEDFIARDQASHKNFQGDETVEGRKRIIADLENLVKLNEKVTTIPSEQLVSQTKKESDLSFEKIDYSQRIQDAKASLEMALQSAAQMHYEKGVVLDAQTTIPDLVKAYDEFVSSQTFVKGFLDAASRQAQTGEKIAELDFALGEKDYAKGDIRSMESALDAFEHGLKYAQLQKLMDAKSTCLLALSEMYYAQAAAYLKGKDVTVQQTQTQSSSNSESMGLKVGIAPTTVVGKVINTLVDAGSPGSSSAKETVTTTTMTRHVIASLDNHYEAMMWLRKLNKINAGYKDSAQLMRQAEGGTQFVDFRNNMTYSTFMVGKVIWMRDNLDWEVQGSSYYIWADKTGKPITDFASGRYYSGLAVSKYKNNLCPAGWRLPTQRDVQDLIANRNLGNVYGDLQFTKLGYGLRISGTPYIGQSFSQSGSGSFGEWWLAEPVSTLNFSKDFKLSTSTLESYHHCRCVKDQQPTN